MKVVEMFASINGEGPCAGELALFVRFQGCNLRCSYCDTMWANEPDCPYALLQPEMPALLTLLADHPELRVEVETNGAVDLAPFCKTSRPVFTMDYKLPSSGWERAMRVENFALLQQEDTVKFVCGSAEDLERAAQVIAEQELTNRCHVYLSPVFGAIEPVEMVEYMIAHRLNGVRLQLQLHKFIWAPDRRGV